MFLIPAWRKYNNMMKFRQRIMIKSDEWCMLCWYMLTTFSQNLINACKVATYVLDDLRKTFETYDVCGFAWTMWCLCLLLCFPLRNCDECVWIVYEILRTFCQYCAKSNIVTYCVLLFSISQSCIATLWRNFVTLVCYVRKVRVRLDSYCTKCWTGVDRCF